MKILKSKTKVFLNRLSNASRHASQIISSFVEIAIVQIVFILQY
jgi:hypothetical protein